MNCGHCLVLSVIWRFIQIEFGGSESAEPEIYIENENLNLWICSNVPLQGIFSSVKKAQNTNSKCINSSKRLTKCFRSLSETAPFLSHETVGCALGRYQSLSSLVASRSHVQKSVSKWSFKRNFGMSRIEI